jgi:hypothetical protein
MARSFKSATALGAAPNLDGADPGFEADLYVDDQGIVLDYQHLFERVAIQK